MSLLTETASGAGAEVKNIRSRESARGPAKGAVIVVKQSVLLLETEPRLVLSIGFHDLGTLMTVVVLVGNTVGVPALGQDDDVGAAAERIREDGTGTQVDVRVVAGSLIC